VREILRIALALKFPSLSFAALSRGLDFYPADGDNRYFRIVVTVYNTIRGHIPEDSNIQLCSVVFNTYFMHKCV
jgi:hypothetical protein